jgi:hypothetical protein
LWFSYVQNYQRLTIENNQLGFLANDFCQEYQAKIAVFANTKVFRFLTKLFAKQPVRTMDLEMPVGILALHAAQNAARFCSFDMESQALSSVKSLFHRRLPQACNQRERGAVLSIHITHCDRPTADR